MILNIILMVSALSMDIFVACAAYGSNHVVFSAKQMAVLNGICSGCLGAALLFGSLIDSWVPEKFTKEICFFSLLFLGCFKLADSGIRQYLRSHKGVHRDVSFVFSKLHFLITIYSDPMEADVDRDCSLSWKEVIFLSLAMSVDCLLTGTMAAFMKLPVCLTMAALFLAGEAGAYLGLWIGRKISTRCPGDISWVSGVFFIIMALAKR